MQILKQLARVTIHLLKGIIVNGSITAGKRLLSKESLIDFPSDSDLLWKNLFSPTKERQIGEFDKVISFFDSSLYLLLDFSISYNDLNL